MEKVYRADVEGGRVHVYEALYVGRRHSWRTYRDIETGEEWHENGFHWYDTPEAALDALIRLLMPSPINDLVRTAFGSRTAEDDYRQMVQACAVLWQLWHRKKGD